MRKLLELLDTVLLDGFVVLYRIGSIIINIIKPPKDPGAIRDSFGSETNGKVVYFYDENTGKYLGRSVDNGNGMFSYFDDVGCEIGLCNSCDRTEVFKSLETSGRIVIHIIESSKQSEFYY